MISLADAGGRIMYSYKELAELAGYTARVHELLTVLRDMRTGRYVRTMVSRGGDAEAGSADYLNGTAESPGEYSLNDIRGVLRKPHDGVRLKNVPIVTPSGDVLVRDLSVDVRPGMHILITGPNGVGKSAIVRIISGLWPIFRGTVYRPDDSGIMFIPQRPYLSIGTLRDQ
jgi:ATP-binding cassette subfamily D (ALD) long-chain fatty acid import protein